MVVKRIVASGLFLAALGAAVYFACCGKYGLGAYFKLLAGCKKREQRIAALTKEIATLKSDIKEWQENPLQQEAFARYDLGMSYTNELVYLIKAK